VETELKEGFLLVSVERPENLGGIEEMRIIQDLLDVKGQQRQIQNQGDPVSVDQEQRRQESVNGGFGDNVRVEAIAQIDRVDIIAFQVRVHYREEDL